MTTGKTQVNGKQVRDGSLGRPDLNQTISGEAVILSVSVDESLSMTETGADAGTGDVTLGVSQAQIDYFTALSVVL